MCEPVQKPQVKQILALMVLPLILAIYSRIALAERVPPADNHQVINMIYDKSAPPADAYIWRTVSGGYDTDNIFLWGRNSWQCLSDTVPDTGQCLTKTHWGSPYGEGSLKLKFTEQHSRLSTVITLKNTKWAAVVGAHWAMDGANAYAGVAEMKLSVWIPSTELIRFPTGGIWKAKLILNEMQWEPTVKVATFSADITLNVTDNVNGAIYLPAFRNATPRVDLNLRTRPLSTAPGGEVYGRADIDMCLYDGYNSHSPWLKVAVSDLKNVPGRPADIFSVSRDGTDGSAATDRVDYRVTMTYNNQPLSVNNGQAITLNSVKSSLIRMVTLPGINVPVACASAPLTLDVLPFAKLNKAAGHFSGMLNVTLSTNTLAP